MIRGNFGIRPGVGGGGASLSNYLDMTAGTMGERRAVLVDGEPVVVQMGASLWQIVTPSAPAQAIVAANPRPSIPDPPPPDHVLHASPWILGEAMNGMYWDDEPLEGPIGPGGRTYSTQLDRYAEYEAAAGVQIYGISALLGNGSASPISGAHIAFGRYSVWNGNWTPTTASGEETNLLSGDPLNGWALATIGGDSDLPVPPADAEALGMAWTDWMLFSAPITWQQGIYVRAFVPARAVAPYLLTFGAVGAGVSEPYANFGVLPARNRIRNLMRGGNSSDIQYSVYWDGDAAISPASFSNSSVGEHYSPKSGYVPSQGFYPPGPVHSPILSLRLLTEIMA